MANNYLFSLQPTFTQGLIFGQLSILVLLGLILKFLFLDSAHHPVSSYHPRVESDPSMRSSKIRREPAFSDRGAESTEWLNAILQQVVEVYRSKLRDNLPGAEGDEIVRKRIEDYANRVRPPGFLDHVKIHSVDLGVSAPLLSNASIKPGKAPEVNAETQFDVTYSDTLSVSLSTSYLFNYPVPSFARLPVSLTISLSLFESLISITPPSPTSSVPVLTISLPSDFTLDLTTTSLIGSRAKLVDVPKLHELIKHQLHRVLAAKGTWKVVLPGLGNVAETREEVVKEGLAELKNWRDPFSSLDGTLLRPNV